MEQKTEFIVDMLTPDSVSILRKPYFEFNGQKYYGENIRNAFMNSEKDRSCLKDLLPEAQYNAVMSVWGENPTVEEPTVEVKEGDT